VILPSCVLLSNHFKAGEGYDFVYFYGAGRLASTRPITNLYDYAAQLKTFNEISPSRYGYYGPSPYPPFIGLFFSLFARLPFKIAFLLWLVTSLALYIVGIGAASKLAFPRERPKRSLLLCFALAYPPFLLFTLANGQVAAVAVFSLALAVYLEGRSLPFWSGFALCLLTYKLTLLLLILPMLILTRRFKALGGFVIGGLSLVVMSTVLAGIQVWSAYAHMLITFRGLSQGQAPGIHHALKRWQFVDLNSLSYAVMGGRSMPGRVILTCIIIGAATWLAVLWWRSAGRSTPIQQLAWATTLVWTLLLNVYAPIYDSTLMTIVVILILGALTDLNWQHATRWTVILALIMYAVSWVTASIAQAHGIQLLTLVLLVFGVIGNLFLQRALAVAVAEEQEFSQFAAPTLFQQHNANG
jgi:hypothetical protein